MRPAGASAAGALTAGAQAVIGARLARYIWLGAYDTDPSASTAGTLTQNLLQVFLRRDMDDKVAAEAVVLEATGTVFHAGPLFDGPISTSRRTLRLELPRPGSDSSTDHEVR